MLLALVHREEEAHQLTKQALLRARRILEENRPPGTGPFADFWDPPGPLRLPPWDAFSEEPPRPPRASSEPSSARRRPTTARRADGPPGHRSRGGDIRGARKPSEAEVASTLAEFDRAFESFFASPPDEPEERARALAEALVRAVDQAEGAKAARRRSARRRRAKAPAAATKTATRRQGR
jgi:hypothetical protein